MVDANKKEPNWRRIFIVYIISEPFRELKELITGVPKLLNKPTVMLTTLAIIALVNIFTKNNKIITASIFGLMLIVFLMKEWRGGNYRRWYREKQTKKNP